MAWLDRFRAFAAKPPGRVVLLVVAALTLTGAFLYLGPFIAIPTFLVFGLLIPILLGVKRPRHLAFMGLAALLIAAPLSSVFYAQELRTPGGPVNSDSTMPSGNGGPVLQNAVVHPFTGAAGATFSFTATLNPQFVPRILGGLVWVNLFVTTCPGATGNSSPFCGAGYPFYLGNLTLAANLTTSQLLSFSMKLPGDNLWWWQLAAAARNATTHNLTYIFLDPGNSYNAVQGPVTGDYSSTLEAVLPAVVVSMLFYPGLVFFAALLVYLLFKSREARRKAQAAAATPPSTPPSGPAASGEAPLAAPVAVESTCPNCNAVVYPNETTCWKCGADLKAPRRTPLPSSKP